MNTEDQIKKYINDKVPVSIIYSTELYEPVWAVLVDESDEFWLDAFPSQQLAIDFCLGHGLNFTVDKN